MAIITIKNVQDITVNHTLIKYAINKNQTWILDAEYGKLIGGGDPIPENVNETLNILDMWMFIEDALICLSKKELQQFDKNACPFHIHKKFSGFDPDDFEHFKIADAMIDELQYFPHFYNRPYSSSSILSLDNYRRMYAVFKELRPLLDKRRLTVDELVQIFTQCVDNDKMKFTFLEKDAF